MIRTSNYAIFKKHGSKWIPVGIFQQQDHYQSLKDAEEVISDLKSGDIPGHSKKASYKIMQLSYCDLDGP